MIHWQLPFLLPDNDVQHDNKIKPALIILNQPFSLPLFLRLWQSTKLHLCADGGANRLYDLFEGAELNDDKLERTDFLPDMIKGDLDSIRPDVKDYYSGLGVPVIEDPDQYSTDLMKCLLSAKELSAFGDFKHDVVVLGGLSGRLDQTIHTLSLFHKLRASDQRLFAVTDDNVGWVLDEGEHTIICDNPAIGPTCGLLPVGIESTILTTRGLQWNLDNQESSFSGVVSTSNAIEEKEVYISTTRPIWWCMEMHVDRL